MFKSMLQNIVFKHMKKKLANLTISEQDVSDVLKQIRITLLDGDVNLQVVKDFIKIVRDKAVGYTLVPGQDPQQVMLQIIKQELVNILGKSTKEINYKNLPLKMMLVGLQGSGKTTSCAKIANFLKAKKLFKVLLVAIDVYRPAAIDQLETLAKEINVDIFLKRNETNVEKITKDALKHAKQNNYDVIIFDTAGRLQTDEKLMKELETVKSLVHPNEILLVVDAMAGQDIINVAKEFNNWLDLSGLVITKLDSNARAGAVLSITHLLNVNVKFVGSGERVGSLDIFYPERMADQIIGLGDMVTLAEKVSDVVDNDKAKKSFSRMLSGRFDLEDLLTQVSQLQRVGSLSSLAKLLPGANNISDEQIENIENKVFVWKVLLSSMTIKERRNPGLFKKNPNRKMRVVKGSGRKPDELNKMLNEWEKAKKKMDEVANQIKSGKNPFANLKNGVF